MLALIYSGSRYANWKLSEKKQIVEEFRTSGINPFFNDEKHILQLLNKQTALINNAEKIKRIYFFGAGAATVEKQKIVENAFAKFFRYAKIQVNTDLLAAAIASCDEKEGIVGVLGSGSTAGYFNGSLIEPNNFGLGYILADEGSANWLGRQLLKDYLYEKLPKDLNQKFIKKYDLNRREILERVYKQQQPTLFLSSFVDFLMENYQHNYVKTVVCYGFDLYIKTYILPLKKQYPPTPIYLAGTVASNFETWLSEVAAKNNLAISSVIKEPINKLLTYYTNKNS